MPDHDKPHCGPERHARPAAAPADGGAPAWPLRPTSLPTCTQAPPRTTPPKGVPYPEALVDDLVSRAQLSGTGRLLDLACGTGEVALALRPYLGAVWALDHEPQMVDLGRSTAVHAGLAHLATAVAGVAARPVSVDRAAGVEIMSYLDGTVPSGGASPPYLWSNDTVTAVAPARLAPSAGGQEQAGPLRALSAR